MRAFDVLVIGGGPAGAALAAVLAGAGRAVAVLERSTFPRAKVCGEFVAAPGVRALQRLGVPLVEDPAAELHRVALWAGDARLEAPVASARAIARETLDALLLQSAARAGAVVYQPATALAVERMRCGAFKILAAPGFEFEARAVAAAHGSWEPGVLPTQYRRSPVRPSDVFGFKAHFTGHRIPAGTIALVPFPGGYAGALGLGGGRATFACSVRRDALRELRRGHPRLGAGEAAFRHALRASVALQEAFGDSAREDAWLAVGPLRLGARPLVRDGVFAVGNAAGEVHPIVGEGITLALHSALALAASLMESRDQAEAAAQYARRYNGFFRRRLWRSACFAALAMHPLLGSCAREALRRMPALLAFAARSGR